MTNTLLNCKGQLLDLSQPVVMGILNVTPDSFFDGGKFNEESNRKMQVEKMLEEGAAIIDIGAVSSRPKAVVVSEDDEWDRLLPALKMMQKDFADILVSVDTFRSTIAERSVAEGASIINDITAGTWDPKILSVAAASKAPYIMMHMQGTPATMQDDPQYDNVTSDVINFFIERIAAARSAGLVDIIIDPGFGFGKTVEHNFSLLNNLDQFKVLQLPLMAGLSRKSMINRVLGVKPENALNGTTVLNTIALMKDAKILRVHDVKEAMDAVKLVKAVNV